MESLFLIEQLFLNFDGILDIEINCRFFFVCCCVEVCLQEDEDFYIFSLFVMVVFYKGLVMLADLFFFYKDLVNLEMGIVICVFYQCFLINILLCWFLVQLFCYLVYNGEINIIMGNCNWLVVCIFKFVFDLLLNLDEILFLVNCIGFDFFSFDNMLELLLVGGMDIYCVVCCMVLFVWQNVEIMDVDLCVFYEYNFMYMEFWDGLVGLVMIDGCYVICMLDCNGL